MLESRSRHVVPCRRQQLSAAAVFWLRGHPAQALQKPLVTLRSFCLKPLNRIGHAIVSILLRLVAHAEPVFHYVPRIY